ncbi:asparagine synthase-related protein [Chitinasiproducens palmae]|uniref:Asparagine synthase n=1 Tax=Chitinasiproducens palmae TaxID=1770053 RepID=A0A1H2PLU2_9BURK|nr:asparagine synthase-related protein [Chitinasiproducens palmae]SDV47058.1 Asparagine synthase [Chitinasiproducens palmae]
MIVGTRDPFGFERLHYHPASGVYAPSIAGVLAAVRQAGGQPSDEIDRCAIAGYLSDARRPGRTVLREVRAVPTGHALLRQPSRPNRLTVQAAPMHVQPADLPTVLRASLQRALDGGKRVALALSGGLDSALLLALLRDLGAHRDVVCYILATGMPDYCEREPALSLAARFDAHVKIVHASEADFVAALRRTVVTVEEPLFNLHPVAKRLLAEAMAADGIQTAVTGDGADQVMRRDRSANYLPLCRALFDAVSVDLHPPFLDAAVVAHLASLPPDPDKQCLRDIGRRLALPDRLVSGPKQGRLAPPMDLSGLADRDCLNAMARALGMPTPSFDTDRDKVLWTTLHLVLDGLGAAQSSE